MTLETKESNLEQLQLSPVHIRARYIRIRNQSREESLSAAKGRPLWLGEILCT